MMLIDNFKSIHIESYLIKKEDDSFEADVLKVLGLMRRKLRVKIVGFSSEGFQVNFNRYENVCTLQAAFENPVDLKSLNSLLQKYSNRLSVPIGS